jgi:hypothetical protein
LKPRESALGPGKNSCRPIASMSRKSTPRCNQSVWSFRPTWCFLPFATVGSSPRGATDLDCSSRPFPTL